MGGKWLELLKEIAPHVTRTAVLREPRAGPASSGAIAAVAPSLGSGGDRRSMCAIPQIEQGIAALRGGRMVV